MTYCTGCGALLSPGVKFCSRCGAAAPAGAVNLCLRCGRPVPAGVRLCAWCAPAAALPAAAAIVPYQVRLVAWLVMIGQSIFTLIGIFIMTELMARPEFRHRFDSSPGLPPDFGEAFFSLILGLGIAFSFIWLGVYFLFAIATLKLRAWGLIGLLVMICLSLAGGLVGFLVLALGETMPGPRALEVGLPALQWVVSLLNFGLYVVCLVLILRNFSAFNAAARAARPGR